MKITTRICLTLLIIAIIIALNWETANELTENDKTPTGAAVQTTILTLSENTTDPLVYFCPRDDCGNELTLWLDAAEQSIHCAFFELNLPNVKEKLINKSKNIDVKIIIDSDYSDEVTGMNFVKFDNKSGYMHNKFCILDGKAVWTGSFNPTERCNYHNNNNAIFYQSLNLAANYETEFAEMWNRTFEKGERTKNPVVSINGKTVESYFCPEDWCANKVIYALQEANKSIYFMTFSFTHDEIEKQILERAAHGVDVKGVFEKMQNSNYSAYHPFKAAGINVKIDGNSANLHHKVFIIDNSTVVTGSFNPTSNGDSRNDENVLIIHDPDVAARYLEEFEYVWTQAK